MQHHCQKLADKCYCMQGVLLKTSGFSISSLFKGDKSDMSIDNDVLIPFLGMGAQWGGMGRRMMQIPTFRESIRNTAKYLKEYGIDLEKLILENDDQSFKNILNSFICTAAIQVNIFQKFSMKCVPIPSNRSTLSLKNPTNMPTTNPADVFCLPFWPLSVLAATFFAPHT